MLLSFIYISSKESPQSIMENVFYFTQKLFSFLRYSNFCYFSSTYLTF